jgi:beta-1,4-mannosyltransferase
MLFHARALAGEGLDVDLIGTEAGELPAFIRDNSRIAVHALADAATRGDADASERRSLIAMFGRGIRLLFSLARLLVWRLPAPSLILVQNPPGVPTMATAWLAARLRGACFAVDWHNLTSAMLEMRLGPRHALVGLTARYEGLFGRAADVNLFVSSHMQQSLRDRFRVTGHVFRDRPADIFVPLDDAERQRVRASVLTRFGGSAGAESPLVVSATSWTADENLDLLLEALRRYDAHARLDHRADQLPSLAVLITGNGPLKRAFEAQVAARPMEHVAIRTAWIEAEEYPRVIAAADLGICCHTSASGLDLPMKVTDMFGAGIPVCAYDYGPCLRELVHPGMNGVLFTTSEECCSQLERLLAGGPGSNAILAALKGGVRESATTSWSAGWAAEARAPLLGQSR